MSIVTRGSVQSTLLDGINKHFFDFAGFPDQWKVLFQTKKSDKSEEIIQEMRGIGTALGKGEGEPTPMFGFGDAFATRFKHQYFACGSIMSRAMIKDNLYPNQVPRIAEQLKQSLREAKNIQAASVLNNGFTAIRSDGVPLFSTLHPISTGFTSNTLTTPTPLSEAGINDVNILIQNQRNQAGQLVNYKPKLLVVGPENQFTASVLLGSKYRPSTPNNDINPIVDIGIFPGGYTVNNYLTNEGAWFVLLDVDDALVHFEREEVYFNIHTEPSTDNVLTTAAERYSFGCANHRVLVGVLAA